MLRVEECGADDGHPNGRDDLLVRVDLRIDNEVQEVLPRRREDRAVLRIGDFDDDALAGHCRAALRELDVPVEVSGRAFLNFPSARPAGDGEDRELPVRARRTVLDPRSGVGAPVAPTRAWRKVWWRSQHPPGAPQL